MVTGKVIIEAKEIPGADGKLPYQALEAALDQRLAKLAEGHPVVGPISITQITVGSGSYLVGAVTVG